MSITILAKYKPKILLAEIFNKSSKNNRNRKEIYNHRKKQKNFFSAAKDSVSKDNKSSKNNKYTNGEERQRDKWEINFQNTA